MNALYSLLLGAVLQSVLATNAVAQAVQVGKKDWQLLHDGVLYAYRAKPMPLNTGHDYDPNGYMGEISVRRSDGTLEFIQQTDRGGGAIAPGCDGDYPVISLVDVPHVEGGRLQTFVVFCGSDSGLSNTLIFYKPGAGVAEELKFGRFIPQLYVHNKTLNAVTYRKVYLDSVCSTIVYPTVYSIEYDGDKINVAENKETYSKKIYEELLKDHEIFYGIHEPGYDMERLADNVPALYGSDGKCLRLESYKHLAEILIGSYLSGQYDRYCRLRKSFDVANGFYQEVSQATSIFLRKCEE